MSGCRDLHSFTVGKNVPVGDAVAHGVKQGKGRHLSLGIHIVEVNTINVSTGNSRN